MSTSISDQGDFILDCEQASFRVGKAKRSRPANCAPRKVVIFLADRFARRLLFAGLFYPARRPVRRRIVGLSP